MNSPAITWRANEIVDSAMREDFDDRRPSTATVANKRDVGVIAKPHCEAKLREAGEQNPRDIAAWGAIVGDITAKLRGVVNVQDDAELETGRERVIGSIVSCATECETTINDLYTTLIHEQSERRRLQKAVSEARAALAHARLQLIRTQAEERRARHDALHDALTLLPNGTFFRNRLNHALLDAKKTVAVLYLDLDGFKAINDTYGHAAGDDLLKIVAARLTRAVRSEDLVSRMAGDEFTCFLVDFPSRTHLDHIASKVFDLVSAPCQIGKVNIVVRPSIGIAVGPDDGCTVNELLQNADAAMYRAKKNKMGHVFFDSAAREMST
jgi:diguanylate cyclase